MTVLILLALLTAQSDDRVKALVDRLGADEVEAREAASRELLALGLDILPDLEKRLASLAEGEIRSRIKAVVERLKRLERIAKLSPEVRLVSVSAKGTPLRALLDDVARQSGVAVECADAIADRPVTLEVKGEPALQAVDRICAARGDVTALDREGKILVSPGSPSLMPAAYVEGFRGRLRRRVVMETGDFGKARMDVVLHAAFDAQPDQKFKTVVPLPGAAAAGPAGAPVTLRSTVDMALGTWVNLGGKAAGTLDDVLFVLEEGDRLEFVYVLKGVPPEVKTLASMRMKARYRFVAGLTPTTAPLTGNRRSSTLGDLPYQVHFSGTMLFLYASPRPGQRTPPQLQDLIDLDSLVIVDGAGKETRLTYQAIRTQSTQYQFTAERELKDEEMTLKYNLLDSADREIDFELKDVKLRD